MEKANFNLNRFKATQEENYQRALREVKEGSKRSHWIWYQDIWYKSYRNSL